MNEISRKFKLSCMRNSLSHCLSVIFRGRCGSQRHGLRMMNACNFSPSPCSPWEGVSVVNSDFTELGRLTCIHTQQYKLLHYYKNCVLILMRVTAAISHPHPAEYVSQLIFVSAVSLGDFPRTLRKWKADVYPHTAV